MNIFIVHAHPEPKSFNAALTHMAREHLNVLGHDVKISDLYAMDWEARSGRSNFTTTKNPDYYKQQQEESFAAVNDGFADDIRKEQEKLFWSDVLIFQFPMWWYSMPAILKGWADRVLADKVTYGNGAWYEHGKLAGRKAMVSMTVGGPESMYSPTGIGGDINQLLFPIQRGIFSFVGFDVLPPFIVWEPARIGDKARKEQLELYRQRLIQLDSTEPILFPGLDEHNPETLMHQLDSY